MQVCQKNVLRFSRLECFQKNPVNKGIEHDFLEVGFHLVGPAGFVEGTINLGGEERLAVGLLYGCVTSVNVFCFDTFGVQAGVLLTTTSVVEQLLEVDQLQGVVDVIPQTLDAVSAVPADMPFHVTPNHLDLAEFAVEFWEQHKCVA